MKIETPSQKKLVNLYFTLMAAFVVPIAIAAALK